MPILRRTLGALGLLLLARPLGAQPAATSPGTGPGTGPTTGPTTEPATIAVEQPWARAAIAGGTGGAFLILRNTGAQADRLLAAATPAARNVEIHETVRDGEVMRMRPVAGIDLPAGASVALRPGGAHVMLIGLAEALRPGATIPLILTFERAGRVEVQVAVQAAGAAGPAAAHRH